MSERTHADHIYFNATKSRSVFGSIPPEIFNDDAITKTLLPEFIESVFYLSGIHVIEQDYVSTG